MALACKIHFKKDGNIDFVENNSGQKSQLFEEARNIFGDQTAVDIMAVTETPSFKDDFGGKVISLSNFSLKTFNSIDAKIPTKVLDAFKEFDRETPLRGEEYYNILKEDIAKHGIRTPITLTIQGRKHLITEGNHRLKIAKELGIETLPVIIKYGNLGEKGVEFFGIEQYQLRASFENIINNKDLLVKQEPTLNEVLKYITFKNVEGQKLSKQEMVDLQLSLSSTTFENSNEMVRVLTEALYPTPTLKSLKRTGIYTDVEAQRIVNNIDLQISIKENLQKLINSGETLENDLDSSEAFQKVDVTETDLIGRSKQYNPYITEQDLIEEFGGIKNKEQLPNADSVVRVNKSTNYANLTEDNEGNYVFYHKGNEGYEVIKRSSGSTLATSREEAAALSKVGGVAMYYTKESDSESMVTGNAKYLVKVAKDKVYDANLDNLNLLQGVKGDGNTQLAILTKLAGERGYDMVVASWAGRTRAQTTKELTPSDVQILDGNRIVKQFEKNYTPNSEKGVKPLKAVDNLQDFYLKVNRERGSQNKYDDLYRLYENNTKLSQEEITKLIDGSDLSQALKDEYDSLISQKIKTGSVITLFDYLKTFKNIPAVDEELKPISKNNTEAFFKETLKSPENNRLEQALDNIEGISSVVWETSPNEIKTLLEDIQKQAIEVGLSLPNFDLKTQAEILDLTRALNLLMHSPSEANLKHFADVYDEFYNVDNSPKREVVAVEEKFRDKNLVSIKTKDTVYKTFKQTGALKIQEGVYLKTDALKRNVEEVYDLIYQNLEIKPELFTLKTAYKNKDMVIEDMKEEVKKEMQELDVFDAEYDSEALQKMILYSKFFGTKLENEKPASRPLIKTEAVEEDFIPNLRVLQLKEKDNQVLQNLVISEDGVHLKYTDPLSIMAYKNYDNPSLKNFMAQQKNTNPQLLEDIEQEDDVTERDEYINFPMLLDQFKGDYKRVSEDIIEIKSAEDFVRIGEDVYENVGKGYYMRLETNDTNSIILGAEQPQLPENLKAAIQPTEESTISIKNLYSAEEGKNMQESLDNCS